MGCWWKVYEWHCATLGRHELAGDRVSELAVADAVNSISVINDFDVWVASNDDIYHWNGKSWDGSKLFVSVSSPIEKYSTVFAISNNNVWAGGLALYHWNGKEWSDMKYDKNYGDIVDIKMTPDQELWALTSFGIIIDLGNQQ